MPVPTGLSIKIPGLTACCCTVWLKPVGYGAALPVLKYVGDKGDWLCVVNGAAVLPLVGYIIGKVVPCPVLEYMVLPWVT